MSKNIKSEKNSSEIFSEQDILDAVDVINRFSSVLEESKVVMAALLLKHANAAITLDDESQQMLLDWAKDFTMLRAKMRNLDEGTKYH